MVGVGGAAGPTAGAIPASTPWNRVRSASGTRVAYAQVREVADAVRGLPLERHAVVT